MAKRTLTKKGRTFQAELKDGAIKVTRKEHVDPPQGKEEITFLYAGVMITEYVSPGQIINKRRAYERFIEKNGDSFTLQDQDNHA